MTTAQVVETSVTVNNDSPIQDLVHPDDYTQPTCEVTPGFKPFTICLLVIKKELGHHFQVQLLCHRKIKKNCHALFSLSENLFLFFFQSL